MFLLNHHAISSGERRLLTEEVGENESWCAWTQLDDEKNGGEVSAFVAAPRDGVYLISESCVFHYHLKCLTVEQRAEIEISGVEDVFNSIGSFSKHGESVCRYPDGHAEDAGARHDGLFRRNGSWD